MKSVKLYAMLRFVAFLLLSLFFTKIHAQDGLTKRPDIFINTNCNGFLQYLPIGYTANPTQKYPLMIYITGIGNTGTGSNSQLELLFTGGGFPHEQQRGGSWVDAYTVNGETHRFVIITPQFKIHMNDHIPTPGEIDSVINYSILNYRIDTSRIYIVGHSQGAGAVWNYAGAGSQYAKRIAAIVPFAGVSFPFQEKANIMKFGKVAVWGFHNSADPLVPSSFTSDYVDFYNNAPTIGITAKKTMPAVAAHDSWRDPLNRVPIAGSALNIYEWMLQYRKEPTTAHAGDDQEIVLPSNSVQLNASGYAPNGTATSYNWEKIFGPAGGGGTLSNPNIANPIASSLVLGTYRFKVTITGSNGSTAIDEVAITVNPTQQRMEAESYTAMSGVVPGSTSDGGPGSTKVDGIDFGDWMTYSVNVPSAGTYRFRFRAGTFYGGTQFKVQTAAGTDLATVVMYGTHWDAYMNLYANVFLEAGTQTIRIQNFPNAGLENRVWFMNWFEIIDNATAMYPLPVNFALFNANCVNGNINLLWKTSGENNSQNFTVEKSLNGRDWISISTIAAAGQSSELRSYNYRDNAAGSGSFYRIVQQDFDGRKTFSAIIKGNCGKEQIFSVYPNPVSDRTTLNISLAKASKLDVMIIDSKGAVVRRQQDILPEGTSQLTVNMNGLANGVYTLTATWDNEKRSMSLIKK